MTENELKNIFSEQDRFAKMCGVVIDSAADGSASGHMDVTPCHLNALGSVQGGAICTLADTVSAAAANSLGKPAVTIQSNVHYVRAARPAGSLTAKATPLARHRLMPSFLVEVTDAEGRSVFESTAIFYVKEP